MIYAYSLLGKLIELLQKHSIPCLYKQMWGIECPGCGMQRSIIALLKGEIIYSLKLFPALLPIIGFVLFFILHAIFKFNNGGKVLKIIGIICLIFFIVPYLIKIFMLWK